MRVVSNCGRAGLSLHVYWNISYIYDLEMCAALEKRSRLVDSQLSKKIWIVRRESVTSHDPKNRWQWWMVLRILSCLYLLVLSVSISLRNADIHSFIPDISIVPLQVHYCSEALLTTAWILCQRLRVNTSKATGNYSLVPALRSSLQNGVRGVSHFQVVSGSLDMKNHRGACPPSGHEWRYCQIQNGGYRPYWKIHPFSLLYHFHV